jgi:hypothetical protein
VGSLLVPQQIRESPPIREVKRFLAVLVIQALSQEPPVCPAEYSTEGLDPAV